MRVAIALCVLMAIGCGGTEIVTFIDDKGKSVGQVDMPIRTVEEMRRGELDMTAHAIVGGSGYLVHCGSYPQPWYGEATLHRQEWWAGDCMVTGSYTNQFWFSLNESFAVWPSDGFYMNNSVRSIQIKALGNNYTAFHTMRNSDLTGGGNSTHTPRGGSVVYGTLLTDAECPAGYCNKPLQSTSSLSYGYYP